ncbi:unnamed protein product, partial [Ilex paraguariensis]
GLGVGGIVITVPASNSRRWVIGLVAMAYRIRGTDEALSSEQWACNQAAHNTLIST